MLKTIGISVWATLFSIGIFYFTLPSPEAEENSDEKVVVLEEIRTEPLAIAIFRKGLVVGHFTTRVRYKLPIGTTEQFPIPVSHMIGDGLYEVLYKMDKDDFTKLEKSELKKMGMELATLLQNRKTPLPIQNVSLENTRVVLK